MCKITVGAAVFLGMIIMTGCKNNEEAGKAQSNSSIKKSLSSNSSNTESTKSSDSNDDRYKGDYIFDKTNFHGGESALYPYTLTFVKRINKNDGVELVYKFTCKNGIPLDQIGNTAETTFILTRVGNKDLTPKTMKDEDLDRTEVSVTSVTLNGKDVDDMEDSTASLKENQAAIVKYEIRAKDKVDWSAPVHLEALDEGETLRSSGEVVIK